MRLSSSSQPMTTTRISTTTKRKPQQRATLKTATMNSTTTTTKKKTTTTASGTTSSPTDKARRLQEILSGYNSVLVAFSGGVDSAYLAIAASAALGPRALAVTADSPSYPETHRRLALSIVERFGFAHEIIRTSELDRPEYRANPANRCYYCKD